MLVNFVCVYDIDFLVRVKIGSVELMLLFCIQQVIFGSNVSIVIDDGWCFYIGDEYCGVVLVGIDSNQVSFIGCCNINVWW